MMWKTIFIIGLIFQYSAESALGPSTGSPPFCDCTVPENCNRDCKWLCGVGTGLEEGTDEVNKKCIKSGGKITPLFNDTIRDVFIPEILEKLSTEAAKVRPPAPDPKCPNCLVLERMSADIKPHKSKEDSCPTKYIRTYIFQKKFSLPGGCSDPQYKKKLYEKALEYVRSFEEEPSDEDLEKPWAQMNPAEKVWSRCPEECSFYTAYSNTIVPQFCENIVNVNIRCGHLKAGGFLGGFVKYDVQIDKVTEKYCKGYQNDKLVLVRTEGYKIQKMPTKKKEATVTSGGGGDR